MKERIACIVERMVLGYLEKLPDRSWVDGDKSKAIVFVYGVARDKVYQGSWGERHKDLIRNNQMYEPGRGESIDDVADRTLRGIWYKDSKILLVYPMYINDRYVDPPESSLNRVMSILKIQPEKIYLFGY